MEEGNIESEIAEQAAVLTGIGIGTAFGLLVLLMAVVILTGSVTDRILRTASVGRRAEAIGDEVEDRNKALAAVVAVAALKARSERGDNEGGGY